MMPGRVPAGDHFSGNSGRIERNLKLNLSAVTAWAEPDAGPGSSFKLTSLPVRATVSESDLHESLAAVGLGCGIEPLSHGCLRLSSEYKPMGRKLPPEIVLVNSFRVTLPVPVP
jgi:hypothetical protein